MSIYDPPAAFLNGESLILLLTQMGMPPVRHVTVLRCINCWYVQFDYDLTAKQKDLLHAVGFDRVMDTETTVPFQYLLRYHQV